MHFKVRLILLLLTVISCQSKRNKENEEVQIGKEVYLTHCISCHQENGEGIPGFYPSLLKPSVIMDAQTQRAIFLIKYGSGFDAGMKPVPLSEGEIVEVVNYIQNSWGNRAALVTVSQVEKTIKR